MLLPDLVLSRSAFLGSLLLSATTLSGPPSYSVSETELLESPSPSLQHFGIPISAATPSQPITLYGSAPLVAKEEDIYREFSTWFRASIHDQVVQSNKVPENQHGERADRNDPKSGNRNANLAGPLIRLAFHDATTFEKAPTKGAATGGPNGSIQYELDWSENRGLARPLAVVQSILQDWNDNQRDPTSPAISLGDAIALAGAQATQSVGGPHIGVRLGRSDATIADPRYLRRELRKETERSVVTTTLPSAALDSDGLRLYFGNERLGLTEMEWVALSGSHGLGRHVSLLGMSKPCLKNLTRTCLEDAPTLLPFVTSGVDRFDNSYFQYLLLWNANNIQLGQIAFIPTDVALVVDSGLRAKVKLFADDNDLYARTFAFAYQKMVEPANGILLSKERY